MSPQIPKKLYEKIHAFMPIVCIDAVIVHNGKFLLCRRTNKPCEGLFWLPGGRVLKGETLKEAVQRKTKEETGLQGKIICQLGTDETFFDDGPFGLPTHTVNFVYLVEVKNLKDLTTDAQHNELLWVTKTDRNAHPYLKKFIKLAQQHYEKRS